MSVAPKILVVRDLKTYFPVRSRILRRQVGCVRAVDGINLEVVSSETLGIVGESGCGKTTLSRTLLRALEPSAGQIVFEDEDVTHLPRRKLQTVRRRMQLVFQNPYGSLDGRMSVGEIIAEPLRIHGLYRGEGRRLVGELLEMVGLGTGAIARYPHEFSGGQRQRIGIARALALRPRLLILDEPVSSLDVSIRSQIVNLLVSLQRELGLTYIFIAHDLSLVQHLADRVAVMYLGKIVEIGPRREVYERPAHPYTQALLSAILPRTPQKGRGQERIVLHGDVPSALDPPSGCRFRGRCWKAQEVCAAVEPPLVDGGGGHAYACHFPGGAPPAGPSSARRMDAAGSTRLT